MTSAAPAGPVVSNTHHELLIDHGLSILEVSSSGAAERYGKGKTPHSGQVWWARRPHASMRALVFAMLCREPTKRAYEILIELAGEHNDTGQITAEAKALLCASGVRPIVVDPFSGGGTIPHEAAGLGAKSYSFDYNPLATFVQTINLDASQRAFAKHGREFTLRTLSEVGLQLLDFAKEATKSLYPGRVLPNAAGQTIVYFWTYSHNCSSCDYEYFVSRRPWISKKSGRELSVDLVDVGQRENCVLSAGDTLSEKRRVVTKANFFSCPKCGQKDDPTIKSCNDRLICTAISKDKARRAYVVNHGEHSLIPDDEYLNKFCNDILIEQNLLLPESEMPRWSGIANPSIYGLIKHKDLFNLRQRAVCLAIIREIRLAHKRVTLEFGPELATYLVGALGGLIDQMVDWNCRLSMWIPQNEQVGRAFCGPGISMLWDYAETDPFGDGPANLYDKLKRIIKAAEAIPTFECMPVVSNSPAQSLPLDDCSVDAVVTDPPYYDNIFYNVLADNFYAWKRLAYDEVMPDLFADEITNSAEELVASKNKHGSSSAAHEWYCEALTAAVGEMARVTKPDGAVAMVYGHSSLLGWEAIVRAFRASKVTVQSMEPLAIERRHRPRAMKSEAVNTCVVVVARKIPRQRPQLDYQSYLNIFKPQATQIVGDLRDAGWAEDDIGMAAFSKAVGILSAISKVDQMTDVEVLKNSAEVVTALLPNFRMSKRGSI